MNREQKTLVNVVHSLDPGGAEKLVVKMSAEFAADYRVTVICLDRPGIWAEALRRQGIPVYCLRRQAGLDLLLVWRLAQKFRRLRADVIHAHQTAPWFYAALSRLIHRKPRLVFEEHGRLFPEPKNVVRRQLNRILIGPLTHAVVAVSKDIQDRLIRHEGLKRDKICVIYNGFEPGQRISPHEREDRRRSLGIDDDDKVIGFVGRLDPVKNLGLLLQALGRIVSKRNDVRGLIIGDGDMMHALVKEAKRIRLADRLVFTGYRSDAIELIQCLDVFVLPSLSEGTSMALLEAMASGVPVVVTDVGGNVEVVEHEVSGLVVRSGSVDELVQAILRVFDQSEISRKMAKTATKKIEATFGYETMIDSYRAVYTSILAAR